MIFFELLSKTVLAGNSVAGSTVAGNRRTDSLEFNSCASVCSLLNKISTNILFRGELEVELRKNISKQDIVTLFNEFSFPKMF